MQFFGQCTVPKLCQAAIGYGKQERIFSILSEDQPQARLVPETVVLWRYQPHRPERVRVPPVMTPNLLKSLPTNPGLGL